MTPRTLIQRPGILLLFLVSAYLVGLTIQVHRGGRTVLGNVTMTVFSPLLETFNGASRFTREGLDAYFWQRDAAERAEKLEVDNLILKTRLQRRLFLEGENNRLRRLLHAPRPESMAAIPGRAFTRFGSSFAKYLIVSVNSSSPIPLKSPVITDAGVVGRVVGHVGSSYKVLLLTNPTSAIGVVSRRTGVRGVAVGDGDHMVIKWVSTRADVKVGDLFETSGEDGVFPAGIAVCSATSVSNGGKYFKVITANPRCRVDKLGWVLFLVKHDG